jgi:hypothetical protein
MTLLGWLNLLSVLACAWAAAFNVALVGRLRAAIRKHQTAARQLEESLNDFTLRVASGRVLVARETDGAAGRLTVEPIGQGDLRVRIEWDPPTTRTVQ